MNLNTKRLTLILSHRRVKGLSNHKGKDTWSQILATAKKR